MALLIRSRTEMKKHLQWRLEILHGEMRRASSIKRQDAVQRHINGITEALECIKSWEENECDHDFTDKCVPDCKCERCGLKYSDR